MIPFNRDLVGYDQYSSHPPRSQQPHLPQKCHSPWWVGRVSAFLEVWKRDATTRLAVQDGSRVVSYCLWRERFTLTCTSQDLHSLANPAQLGLKLSDFMTIGPENDCDITFDWGGYRRSLKKEIEDLALYRYQKQRDSRLDNHNDLDYHS